MSSSDQNKASFGNPIINLLLAGMVFLFFTWILRAHVPAKTVWLNWILAGFAATAVTLTFYFALNMFRVTMSDHKNRQD